MKRGAVRNRKRISIYRDQSETDLPQKDAACDEDRAFEIFTQALRDYETLRQKYYGVVAFILFAGVYLLVLYFQSSHGHSYEVVSSLRNAFVPGASLSSRFQTKDQLLGYIAGRVVLPIWQDPVCGDDICQWPWEFPAFGRFGCRADCGEEKNTTRLLLQIKANFAGQRSLSPRTLMANVRWNLCLKDADRVKRGQEELCWFAEDQTFSEVVVNQLESMEVINGEWNVKVQGDYTSKVSGKVYDISNITNPILIQAQVEKESEAVGNASVVVACME